MDTLNATQMVPNWIVEEVAFEDGLESGIRINYTLVNFEVDYLVLKKYQKGNERHLGV